MRYLLGLSAFLVVGMGSAACHQARAEVTAERSQAGAVVKVDGQLFTEYITNFHGTPILWPILGPTGKKMTRSYPMAEGDASERKDHPHHRSFWFTHGDVDGLSFWHVETIRHKRFTKIASGRVAEIVSENEWVGPDGRVHCEDQRRLKFGADKDLRWIDFDVTIKAPHRDVRFGDTKEGTFGIRVAGTMKVDAAKTDKGKTDASKINPRGGGRIVNSEGLVNRQAWGKRAPWVDYHGPVEGETLGIAILNHPSSFRFPTYWHVRTYGLFAANPFGWHNFENSDQVDGSYTIKQGESITLRYRVLFHKGDEKEADVAGAFAAYAAEEKPAK